MPAKDKRIAIASNPKSKKAKDIASGISKMLHDRHVIHMVFSDHWPTAWEGFSEVWIVGGVGTLNYFVNRYPDISLPLAIFNGGSGNDFHWVLYGNISPDQQIDQVLNGKPHRVDAGRCNGFLFMNGIGIGFDGKVAKDIANTKRRGKGMYLLTILKNIFFFRSFACVIADHDRRLDQQCFMISVANGRRYGGGFHVTPGADFDDGVFDVNIVGRIHPLLRVRYLPVIERGEHRKLRFIKYFSTDKILIAASTNIPAHADGEYFTSASFEIECLPLKFCFIK